jgi:membrane protease subunit HflC
MSKNKILLIALPVLLLIILYTSLFTVSETDQVLVLQFGKHVRTINSTNKSEAGIHIKIPFVQSLKYYDKRLLNLDPPSEEVTLNDQKRLVVDSITRYKITDPLQFYRTVKDKYSGYSRLNDIVNSSVRDVLGKKILSDLLSESRITIMEEIYNKVSKQAKEIGVEIADVRIKRADLPEETEASIYARMISTLEKIAKEIRAQGREEQQKIKAQADLESTKIISEGKKTAEILRGQADKEAINMWLKVARSEPKFFEFYRSMQSYLESINTKDKRIILDTDSDYFKYLKNK